MGYPLRLVEPDKLYFVTNRCFQGRLFMRPDPQANRVIGGALARAVHKHDIELYGFVFLGNHFHLIVGAARPDALSAFVGQLESTIARRLGPRIGWSGKFWQRRYSAEAILDDDALMGRLKYILAHSVKEGLTETAAEWPGLHCLPELAHGQVRVFQWEDKTELCKAKAKTKAGETVDPAEFLIPYELSVRPLPGWQELPEEQRQRLVRQTIWDVEQEARAARRGKPPLGLAGILAQQPTDKPVSSKQAPRPLCHTASRKVYQAFKETYRAFQHAYWEASDLFRQGIAEVEFPPHCFLPPLPCQWVPVPSG